MDRVKDAMVAGNRKGVEMAAEHMGVAACRGEESHEGHGGQCDSPPPDMPTRSPSACFPFVDRMI
jgi:hypothetical protein